MRSSARRARVPTLRRVSALATMGAVVGALGVLFPALAGADGWSGQPTVAPPGAQSSFLWSVSCSAPGRCVAVGYYTTSAGMFPLAEQLGPNGWQLEPIVVPAGVEGSFLLGVSCVTTSDCTAVGGTATSAGFGSLVEHWDGAGWTLEDAANVGELRAVSCASADACMAVGMNNHGSAPVAERFDGSRWTAQTIPWLPNVNIGEFDGVSCATPRDCIAVGSVTEHWDGSDWSIMSTAFSSTGDGFTAVSCVTADDCTAVGAPPEQWDGSSWQVEPGAGTVGVLNAVSCASAGECTGVGDSAISPTDASEVVAVFTNGSWSQESVTRPANEPVSGFFGVSCVTAEDCVAVGAAGAGLDELQASGSSAELDLAPVAGTVSLLPPGQPAGSFQPLLREQIVSPGSIVNTVHGTIELSSSTSAATDSGDFYGGLFILNTAATGGVNLRLAGGTYTGCRKRIRHHPRRTRTTHRVVRHLTAQVSGSFQVIGRYSTATANNASWTTDDRCDGTMTIVQHGTVLVTDLRHHVHVRVTAGHRYLA